MQIKISLKPASEVGRIIGESFKPFCRQIGKIGRLKEPVAQLINPAVMDHSMTGNCILIYKIMHFGQGMDLDRQDCMFCNTLKSQCCHACLAGRLCCLLHGAIFLY